MPSRTNDFVLLDAGANPVCEPLHLAQFAVMGSVYARDILGHKNPRVGILSNGTEESKGNDLTRVAARLCSQLDLNFIGYVEGFDLFDDAVEVVVADGFIGNVVLKTSESLGNAIVHMLRNELSASPLRKLGAIFSRGALRHIKQRLDPEALWRRRAARPQRPCHQGPRLLARMRHDERYPSGDPRDPPRCQPNHLPANRDRERTPGCR